MSESELTTCIYCLLFFCGFLIFCCIALICLLLNNESATIKSLKSQRDDYRNAAFNFAQSADYWFTRYKDLSRVREEKEERKSIAMLN